MKAIITGASRGVGRGIAISLAKVGYDVVITGRTASALSNVRKEIEANDVQCEILVCDHSDLAATVQAFESIEDTSFDIVVNNAWGGYERMVEDGTFTWEKKFWEQPDHRWTSMMDVGGFPLSWTGPHRGGNGERRVLQSGKLGVARV